MARVGRILVDVAPLRHDRDYRWLWSGQLVNGIGTQITRLALPYQAYTLTGSTLAIAALTAVQLVPILVFSLGAGSLADAIDRRRLLRITQASLAACSLALAILSAQASPSLPLLFVVAFLAAGLSAVDNPTRMSSIPRLVPASRLSSALALNQLATQTSSLIGPALGGVLIATIGLTGAYLVDAASFGATLLALIVIRPLPPLVDARRPGLQAIREGVRFVRGRPPIMGSITIDLAAMVFALPTSLLPVLAQDVYRVGPAGLGLLAAAPAIGATAAALLSGWVHRVRHIGRAVIACVVVWGLAIATLGATTFVPGPPGFVLGLVAFAVAGSADTLSAVFRNTITQLDTPDDLRGRVSSIYILTVTAGPRLGDIESALLAVALGPGVTILVGGLLCLAAVGAMERWLPELGRYAVDRGEPVAR